MYQTNIGNPLDVASRSQKCPVLPSFAFLGVSSPGLIPLKFLLSPGLGWAGLQEATLGSPTWIIASVCSQADADADQLCSRESLRSRHRIISPILISVPGLGRGEDWGHERFSLLLPFFPHLPKLAASPWLSVWGLEGGECGCGGWLEKLSLALPVARPASHPLSGAHTRPPRHTPRAPLRSPSPARRRLLSPSCSPRSPSPFFFFFFFFGTIELL